MLNPSIPLVATRHGKIVGVVQEEIHIWRGIPYAAPPTGELRWRAPQPVTPWQDVRQADCFSCASWQDITWCRELGGGDPGNFSEDCLYLNVWAPPYVMNRCRSWSGYTAAVTLLAREVCRPMTVKRWRSAARSW